MSRPRRLNGFDYVGRNRYFLTFCTRHRMPVLRDAEIAPFVIAQFRRAAGRHQFAVIAYCLMPDHAHALVEGLTDQAKLRAFVKSAKESSGRSGRAS